MGDSKTSSFGFQPELISLLQSVFPTLTYLPTQLAGSGWKVADMDAATSAWAIGYSPDLIFLDIGVNDADVGTSQSSFEASLASILDKVHAGFPRSKVYVERVWKLGRDTQCDLVDNIWIPNVLASRSSFAFVGGDERIYLKGSDNGATFTADGTHPNAAGYSAGAAARKAAAGF